MTVPTGDYIRLRFAAGGRARPEVDCWGLYRLIVGERTGIWLGDYAGIERDLAIARTLKREEAGGSWRPVEPGEERALDLVLMKGVIGEGRTAATAPLHVGCVVDEGRMIDIEETNGVLVRAFRPTPRCRAHPTVINRVLGMYRPRALESGAPA